ncbi:MAG TPA: response regulator transcription factor [Acidimicrobiales bacterium]|jgi:two-component system KDP operon response regulator KdpE|nr:response regulator transcription factor [Acidimicrobiales bacterium]
MATVLVIDDDPSLLRALRLGLKAGGHEVLTAVNGERGISQTALKSPDVVVLDMGLPDMDGLVVCQRIRQWSDVPIIVLSATGSEERKIDALNGGADDYVTKPFSMGELEARIRAVLRNRPSEADEQTSSELSLGTLELDLVHHEVRLKGEKVNLTTKEFNLLAYLARYAGRTCTYQMILQAVWGTGYGDEAAYVHAYVHRLRQKLNDESGTLIETMPGVGYSLQPQT